MKIKKCKICNKEFTPRMGTEIYCSWKCVSNPEFKKKRASRLISGKLLKGWMNSKKVHLPDSFFRCVSCNGLDEKLEIHHEVYPVKKEEVIEAIKNKKIYFLCLKCHKNLHNSERGYK